MSDSFEFTLHSPLTQEDWNKLSDAELENSMSVTFQTSQGRQVRYIKCEVLDKIRAEIEDIAFDWQEIDGEHESLMVVNLNDVLQIIDKYKAESEVDE